MRSTFRDHSPPNAGSLRPPLRLDPDSWEVTHQDIEQALEISSNTKPGPDSIPYGAWRALGKLAVDILYDVTSTLSQASAPDLLREAYEDETTDGQHDFNLSTLICLPKKPTGHDDEAGTYFSPGNTRPLSIVNTDNRLIANAARLRWESILDKWISSNQQGFLPGRSMLSNLVALDTTSMHTALSGPNGAVVLFDFRAAFPSLAPGFLFQMLRRIGIPENAINFVSSLYDNNRCQISYKGDLYPGFTMSGVRQGCPLSPLLYALAADVLLEKIATSLPEAWVRAYADDTAVVLSDFWSQAPRLGSIFEAFAKISNLHLNIDKCVLIPLHPRGPQLPAHLSNARPPTQADVRLRDNAPNPAGDSAERKSGSSNSDKSIDGPNRSEPNSPDSPTTRASTSQTTTPATRLKQQMEGALQTLGHNLQQHLWGWRNMKLSGKESIWGS